MKLTAFEEPDGDIDGDIIETERTKPGWVKGEKTLNWKEIKSFFGIPGQEKERPEDVTIYSEMIKLSQDTSFDYFIGELQILG